MNHDQPLDILIIEDNELDARSMVRALSRARTADGQPGFTTERVADLASATAQLDANHFDCVILDLSLPDSVGLVAVDVLSEQAPGCPIVVLTGLDDPDTALEAVERGAQDYLSKQQADADSLTRAIRYAVARQHSEVALRAATAQLDLLRDRERIARDLHDTVIQQLFAAGLGLESMAVTIDDADLQNRVRGAVGSIDAAIQQLREAIFGLHAIPEELALSQAITELAGDKAGALGFHPIVEVGPLPDDLPTGIRHEVVQIVSEGLSNVVKHAKATATRIVVSSDGDELTVSVVDNGRGMPDAGTDRDRTGGARSGGTRPGVGSAEPEATGAGTGHGLRNMRERADSLHGHFHIGPGAGGGTRIEWRVPLTGRPNPPRGPKGRTRPGEIGDVRP